jgi:hypothetical protein
MCVYTYIYIYIYIPFPIIAENAEGSISYTLDPLVASPFSKPFIAIITLLCIMLKYINTYIYIDTYMLSYTLDS